MDFDGQYNQIQQRPSFMESQNAGVDTSRSYKEMLEVLKHVNKSCDFLADQICELNMTFADEISKAALLINPSVTRILHMEDPSHPEPLTSSQLHERMSLTELDKNYAEMCIALDHRENNKKEERNSEAMMEKQKDTNKN